MFPFSSAHARSLGKKIEKKDKLPLLRFIYDKYVGKQAKLLFTEGLRHIIVIISVRAEIFPCPERICDSFSGHGFMFGSHIRLARFRRYWHHYPVPME